PNPPPNPQDASVGEEDNLLGSVLASVFAGLFTWDEGSSDDSDEPRPPLRYFPRHPYPRGRSGFMRFEPASLPGTPTPKEDAIWLKPWSARLSIEEGNDFDHLNRVGVRGLVEGSSGWGVQANGDWYHEQLRCGCGDDLGLFDVNLTYRLAEGKRALWRC